ncbi:MAG TPA: hypothetical protein VG097_05170 [Gemmata sp.]|jgi:hypothetical protein|nr:hypothetical protein [Gemmata sp.]
MELDKIADTFVECFQDAGVFERSSGGTIVETDVVRKENKKWIVVAAGISEGVANDLFPLNAKRAERACEPVTIIPDGQLSLLLVLRPVSFPIQNLTDLDNVTTFSPGKGVPVVQLRQGSFLRIWDIRDEKSSIHSLRWELDNVQALQDPHESWLTEWRRYLSFNPAHPASHLHINTVPYVPNSEENERIEHSRDELRLGIGVPNPLGLILSIAAWLRALPNT